jgi:hypothetical protein
MKEHPEKFEDPNDDEKIFGVSLNDYSSPTKLPPSEEKFYDDLYSKEKKLAEEWQRKDKH